MTEVVFILFLFDLKESVQLYLLHIIGSIRHLKILLEDSFFRLFVYKRKCI